MRIHPDDYPRQWISEGEVATRVGKNMRSGTTQLVELYPQMTWAVPKVKPWWERRDPYWDALKLPNLKWREKEADPTSPIEPYRKVAASRVGREILSALASWGHLTRGQLQVLISVAGSYVLETVKTMFDLGVIRYGTPTKGTVRTEQILTLHKGLGLRRVIRLGEPHDLPSHVVNRKQNTQSALHDQLTAELACRLIENVHHSKVKGVVPPQRMALEDLLGSHVRVPGKSPVGDFAVMLEDRLVIVEVERKTKMLTTLTTKIAEWAAILYENPILASHVAVLFVTASHDDPVAGVTTTVKAVEEALSDRTLAWACRVNPNDLSPDTQAKARSQIQVAVWEDWFPGPGLISKAFTDLEATVWKTKPGSVLYDRHPLPLREHLMTFDAAEHPPADMIRLAARHEAPLDDQMIRLGKPRRPDPGTMPPVPDTRPVKPYVVLPDNPQEVKGVLTGLLDSAVIQTDFRVKWPQADWVAKVQPWFESQVRERQR